LEAIRRDMSLLDARNLDLYLSDLDAGEDALAWEKLVRVADAQGASADVWARLVDAAEAMELESDDDIFGPPVRLALGHLPTP
jgi:hypothetical protein